MLHISIRDKIRDKVRNTKIRKNTGVTDIIRTAKQVKWSWVEH